MKLYTEAELTNLTLKAITAHNTALCEMSGNTPTKRFATKPAAIKKTLANQVICAPYIDVEPKAELGSKVKERDQAKVDTKPLADHVPTKQGKKFKQVLPVTTLKECKLLVKIAESEYTELNGAEPSNAQETATWANCVLESKADGGVFASLLKKQLVNSDGENTEDHTVSLTLIGFVAYKAYKDAQFGKELEKQDLPAKKQTPAKTAKQNSDKKPAAKVYEQLTFSVGEKPAREGTVHALFVSIIEDNLGEADFETVATGFKKVYTKVDAEKLTNSFIWSYLRGAVNYGRVNTK